MPGPSIRPQTKPPATAGFGSLLSGMIGMMGGQGPLQQMLSNTW
jgi:hypothetical protein